MPRESVSSLAAPRIDGKPLPLLAPVDMSAPARAIWDSVVAAVRAEHFHASDLPLLRSYCEASALADQAAAELAAHGAVVDGKLSPWLAVHEKATRTQNTMAVRLRLCPSARNDPKTTGRKRPPGVPDIDFRRWSGEE
ncbi:MAG TPA: P27 family phage terminase small subunit [Steroidobacteraceae bacterium]|nr:P27 family phage terminase small subunit [Steroidobacteraceae bacterium]